MQVTNVKVAPVELGLRLPYQTARSPEIDRVTVVFVRVEARQGRIVWGCAALDEGLTGELFRLAKESGQQITQAQISPEALAELIGLVKEGAINQNTGKEVLGEMFAGGRSAREIVEERGLAQISDATALEQVVAKDLPPHR